MAYLDSVGTLVSLRSMTKAVVLAALLSTLSACGGGDSADSGLVQTPAPPPPPPPPQQAITGVAIPSNVSVVTANNAG